MNGESMGYGAMMIALVVGLAFILYGVFSHVVQLYIVVGGAIVLLCMVWLTLQADALGH